MGLKTVNVVAAIVVRDNTILATQRGYGDYEGWWEFPGGKVEPGETPEQALIREIAEELNTAITVDSFLCCAEYDYPKFHLSMQCYLCSHIDPSFQLLEHHAARWLTIDQLDEVKWLPADIEVLDAIRAAHVI